MNKAYVLMDDLFANVLNGVMPFLLLPILTIVFMPEEYGLVTLISAVIAIIGAFTGLSVLSVKYFDGLQVKSSPTPFTAYECS
ncbi:hypothetical protein [Methylotenera sp.]|uniref:hypothetical protein n=1 Tax=Methylotenera sp. TaxID=2051956 RepID=UPI00272F5FF8|nr:hypothetical protein [Methylotenera sp.]MDP2230729.1 hypothetical protein [Methylotenera sp.]